MPGNLPVALNSFVGREAELDAVADLVRHHRLVTLTGPAGIGKTRLAFEAVRGLPSASVGNVWLVELASVNDGDAVVDAVALVLSARETPHRSMLDALVGRLGQPTLLVLDNCEHVVESCASVGEFLLQRCPRLRLLATSREPLGIAGEVVCHVPPLAVPSPDEVGDLEALGACEAVRLFVGRAEPSFSITPAVAPAVSEICRRLDGIPLAIELAAARVGFLTPDQIAYRLDDRFHLLTAGHRRTSARHRTLLAALEWSYGLLSDKERLVLRRLAAFSGGWSLEAAEEVCPGGGVEPGEVLDLLGRLVTQSLVVCELTGPATRFGFLETVREFAREKLAASGEDQAVRAAHAAWCTALAETAEGAMTGADQARWLERLEIERANLQGALEWSLGSTAEDTAEPGGRSELALRLAGAMTLFWLGRRRMSEGRAWLERCAAGAPGAPPRLRVKALWGAGATAAMLGDFDRARTAGEECLALARRSEDLGGAARALNLLGFVSSFRDLPKARPLLEESVVAASLALDRWCLANSLGLLGFAEIFRGDFTAAGPYFERCLDVATESGDQQGLQTALLGTGYVALQRGAYERAEAALTDGLEVSHRLGDAFWTSVALAYLGELARVRGDVDRARQWSEEGLALARETGSQLLLGFLLGFAGRAALDAGSVKEAQVEFEEALALPRIAGNPGNSAVALLGLAEVFLALARPDRAGPLFDEGLTVALDRGDRLMIASLQLGCARFARSQGEPARAAAFAHAALDLSAEIGHPPGMAAALEVVAGLAAGEGRLDYAARLLGAARALRDETGCLCGPSEQPALDSDLAALAAGLSPAALEAAWNQGAGLSPEEACAYAHRGRGPRRRPSTGWASLTPAELEVVRLVAEGLTNAEIGERLFVSRRTVQTHLSHAFAKLGFHSRRELARAALADPER
jgi:predicted ATPase/DNA-binding CsgD family transcriptional regulator